MTFQSSPELSIVIVNWNGGELLQRCIESIARHRPQVSYEIILVDNASLDSSVAWARSAAVAAMLGDAPLRLIQNPENAGFGRANNQAFAVSLAPLLLLLNADTEVTAGAMDALIATIREDSRAGAAGPRLVSPDGSLQPSVWPSPSTPWEIALSGLGLWRFLPKGIRGRLLYARHWTYDHRASVPMVFGAAMIVRREVIEQIGGFDERFAMYAEDDEWCLRMTRAGWQVIFEPRAEVIHQSGHFSLQRWGALGKLRVQTEGWCQLQRLTLSRPHRIANLVTGCVVMTAQILARRLRRQPAEDLRLIRGIYAAGLLGKAEGRRQKAEG